MCVRSAGGDVEVSELTWTRRRPGRAVVAALALGGSGWFVFVAVSRVLDRRTEQAALARFVEELDAARAAGPPFAGEAAFVAERAREGDQGSAVPAQFLREDFSRASREDQVLVQKWAGVVERAKRQRD